MGGPEPLWMSRIVQLITYMFTVIEILIALRFVLRLLGGNAANPFVAFIYTFSYPFVFPFLSVFRAPRITTGVSVFEIGSLFAILIYLMLNYLIVKLIRILSP